MTKQKSNRERISLLPVLLLALVLIACCAAAVTALTPERYTVQVGDIAAENIAAPRQVEDTATTEALRSAARNATKPVYTLDDALIRTYTTEATAFFNDVAALRESAQTRRTLNALSAGVAEEGQLSAEDWAKVIPEDAMRSLLTTLKVALTADEGYALLHADDTEILRLKDATLPKITTSLQSGLEEQAIAARRTAYTQELSVISLDHALRTAGEKLLYAYLQPTFVVDEQSTNKARETNAESVEPVVIARGERIVEQGAAITEAQFDMLSALGLVRADQADIRLTVGVMLYIVCAFGCFAAYLLFYYRKLFSATKPMLLISVSIIFTVVLAFVCSKIDYRIVPSLIGVMLIALLLDSRIAMAANLLLSLCIGLLMGGWGSTMLGYDSVVTTVSILAGGQTAIFMLRKYNKRGTLIAAGLAGGVAAGLVVMAAGVMTSRAFAPTLLWTAWAVGSNVIAAVLVAGSLSLFEHLFDIATSARLNELSNANNPLLKRLMTEAPGTYHHSMMTAALAEAAAEVIGADALLARVGAYYHDAGKLARPLYFKENQNPNENIHDTLPAAESATIIIAHLKDGVALLHKYKLPASVVQITFEHHGTTMAAYFYHKAKQESPNKQIAQKAFRYPGARPTTRESAIVLLADSCEAAVRSLASPTREEIEELVEKIIKGKVEDGQLAVCPLTFKELTQIQQSFLRTFGGMRHERVAYPGQEEKR